MTALAARLATSYGPEPQGQAFNRHDNHCDVCPVCSCIRLCKSIDSLLLSTYLYHVRRVVWLVLVVAPNYHCLMGFDLCAAVSSSVSWNYVFFMRSGDFQYLGRVSSGKGDASNAGLLTLAQ